MELIMRPDQIEILRAGIEALRAAKVEPLGLDIRPDGEWSLYQFVALPGHPSPGNAGRGFTHPHPITGEALRFSSGRYGRTRGGALLISLDGWDDAAIHAWCASIARAIWPGSPHTSQIERRSEDGMLLGVAITRRIVDPVRLVTVALIQGSDGVKACQRGGEA